MSLEINIRNLATRIATEFKALRVVTGSLANLTTTQKGNLVAALNELQAAIASATNINDAAAGPSTTYSSQKIEAQIQGAISALVAAASDIPNGGQALVTGSMPPRVAYRHTDGTLYYGSVYSATP